MYFGEKLQPPKANDPTDFHHGRTRTLRGLVEGNGMMSCRPKVNLCCQWIDLW